jgi:putative flippase GtrA
MQRNVIPLIKKNNSIFRWALVGSVTSVIDYLIFITFFSMTNSVLFSNFCAGGTSITFNYLAHYTWSFRSNANHSNAGIKYVSNLCIFWSLGTLLLSNFISAGVDPKIAKILPIPITAPLSYISLKKFVFKRAVTKSQHALKN